MGVLYKKLLIHTFLQMPQIKVVSDVLQDIPHMTCNLNMSVRY